jgi:drug/metabolite transporter (DMT)-like permease
MGFGTLPIFGTWAATAGLNTTTLLSFRFLIGSVLVVGTVGAIGGLQVRSRRELLLMSGIGVMYAVFSGFFFWGLRYVPAGVAGIVFYTYPVFVYVLSMTFLGETVTSRKVLALVLSVSGVVLIVGGDSGTIHLVGLVLVLLAAVGNATYIAASRAMLGSIRPDVFISTTLVVTTVAFFTFGAGTGALSVPRSQTQWLIVGGIGLLGTALPLLLYMRGLARIEASKASIVGTAEPVVTVLLSVALLGETLSPQVVLGGGLVIGGVIVIQRAQADGHATAPRGGPHGDGD